MARKREDSNTKKAKGIWHLETRADYQSIVRKIPEKQWQDLTGTDLYRLFEHKWKMGDVQAKWHVSPTQVINKLRLS